MSGLEDQLNVKRAFILNNAATTFLLPKDYVMVG